MKKYKNGRWISASLYANYHYKTVLNKEMWQGVTIDKFIDNNKWKCIDIYKNHNQNGASIDFLYK